eukprot:CAMPEP_0113462136 /NCGR_PEP_ID=MMETSP0014_2-20120614/11921_1 /TAXON_ID=2857 /ORGANISM="Nitzschia sp." /LENGTH=303 /DNA_ID=CAMNT_0000353959 /DNA_START=146 /DNA_END=1057 /DNA_ORIENTATION=- /assembly_acc=CAM_ASM_000159
MADQQQQRQQGERVHKTTIDIQMVTGRMARRENELKKGIQDIQTQAVATADRLTTDVDRILDEPVLKKFRTTLKEIAAENVHQDRELKSYMNALKVLGDRTSSATTANDDEDEADEGQLEPDDFQTMIEEAMNEERAKLERNSVDVTKERMYTKMLERLKEETPDEGGNKNGDGDDSDDDLLIVSVNGGPPGSSENLKCPITTQLMEEPVRNTVCGHVYSMEGIKQILKSSSSNRRGTKCPVAGCQNGNVTKSQLQVDDDLKIKIRRLKKRQSIEKKSRTKTSSSQSSSKKNTLTIDDDDDDE